MLCPVCDGSGKLLNKVCPLCDGLNEASTDDDEGSNDLNFTVGKTTVIVRRMDGEVLFGPMSMNLNTPVSVLRDEVLEGCLKLGMDPCEVTLFQDGHELADDECLPGDECVDILAVLQLLELSDEDRASCFDKLFNVDVEYFQWQSEVKDFLERSVPSLSAAARADRKLMLQVVRCDGLALQYVHKFLQADKELVTAAVSEDSSALQYAHDSLRADCEVVIKAALMGHNRTSWGRACVLQYVHASLKDPAVEAALVLEILSNARNDQSSILLYVNPDVKADREFMRKATLLQHNCLRHASKALKSDKDFVLELVREIGAGRLLNQVHQSVRDDPDVRAHVRHWLM